MLTVNYLIQAEIPVIVPLRTMQCADRPIHQSTTTVLYWRLATTTRLVVGTKRRPSRSSTDPTDHTDRSTYWSSCNAGGAAGGGGSSDDDDDDEDKEEECLFNFCSCGGSRNNVALVEHARQWHQNQQLREDVRDIHHKLDDDNISSTIIFHDGDGYGCSWWEK